MSNTNTCESLNKLFQERADGKQLSFNESVERIIKSSVRDFKDIHVDHEFNDMPIKEDSNIPEYQKIAAQSLFSMAHAVAEARAANNGDNELEIPPEEQSKFGTSYINLEEAEKKLVDAFKEVSQISGIPALNVNSFQDILKVENDWQKLTP